MYPSPVSWQGTYSIMLKNAALFIRLKEMKDEEKVLAAVAPFKGVVLKGELLADSSNKLKEVLPDA